MAEYSRGYQMDSIIALMFVEITLINAVLPDMGCVKTKLYKEHRSYFGKVLKEMIWNFKGSSAIECSAKCLRSDTCKAISFIPASRTCIGYSEDEVAIADLIMRGLFHEISGARFMIHTSCKEGWIHRQNHRYCFNQQQLDSNAAKDACKDMGGHLVDITTEEEDIIIGQFVEHYYLHNTILVDGTDEKHEGSWEWRHSGEPVLYTNWVNGEPNNGLGGGQNCMAISWGWALQTKWDDVYCIFPYKFMCEL